MRRLHVIGRLAGAVAAIAGVTAVYSLAVEVNPTTIALTYVVVILLIATGWGIAEATTASLVAVLCFNFFFLPPVGTLTIADPQNWVALLAFLLTAVVASQLSGRARRRHVEAVARQGDLERLYALSRALLLSEHGPSAPRGIARHIADAFEARTVGLYDRRTDTVSWGGSTDFPALEERLREAARTGASQRETDDVVMTAIQLGGTPIGSLAVAGARLNDTVLQSIANLAAIGLERASASDTTARAEAARHSSELRATVLDALAHEFKTPLTSMKAASSDLRASRFTNARDRELIAIIDEDVDRFQALVTDAVQMLRIDAGDFVVHAARQPVAAIVAPIVKKFGAQLDGHNLVERIPPDLTVDADPHLLALALRQLLDNALKYSPVASSIEIGARGNGHVEMTVRNSGSIIPEAERTRIFERFYRGTHAGQIPGTGMGLSIVQQIARAHGGTLAVHSSPDDGTTFTLSLPYAADVGVARSDASRGAAS